MIPQIETFGDLKNQGYTYQSIKAELKKNLISKIKNGDEIFPGLIGYDDSVIPELKRAIVAGHNINLLGLRGQAKTRIARSMIHFLDEYIPVVEGSEINDDPFNPISKFAREQIQDLGDKTPIKWLHRDQRFFEKLATPDVNIGDLIGDIDPIKAANLKLSYSDERVLHYGMIPRANRCIFVINELPDLQARIQVSLFNILQEGDVQIRGFQLRMPLDLQFVFTANPEDYTNRGSIVTPLKDRIGSQIFTHYPKSISIAKQITTQEAEIARLDSENIFVPELAKDLLEQVSFSARKSPYIDLKSGVSARLSISAFENLISAAFLRNLELNLKETTIRLGDFFSIIPAISGKVELVYEGEQEGADFVAKKLIGEAAKSVFLNYFPEPKKLEREDEKTPYSNLLDWFVLNPILEVSSNVEDKTYKSELDLIEPLSDLIEQYCPDLPSSERYFMKEIILWALVEFKRLDKKESDDVFQFQTTIFNTSKGYREM